MKNKNKFIIIIFFISLFLSSYSNSSESFNFDVSEIEIRENGNKFIGKNKGTATSADGTMIDANYFEYDKIKNILISSGNLKADLIHNRYLETPGSSSSFTGSQRSFNLSLGLLK